MKLLRQAAELREGQKKPPLADLRDLVGGAVQHAAQLFPRGAPAVGLARQLLDHVAQYAHISHTSDLLNYKNNNKTDPVILQCLRLYSQYTQIHPEMQVVPAKKSGENEKIFSESSHLKASGTADAAPEAQKMQEVRPQTSMMTGRIRGDRLVFLYR